MSNNKRSLEDILEDLVYEVRRPNDERPTAEPIVEHLERIQVELNNIGGAIDFLTKNIQAKAE